MKEYEESKNDSKDFLCKLLEEWRCHLERWRRLQEKKVWWRRNQFELG